MNYWIGYCEAQAFQGWNRGEETHENCRTYKGTPEYTVNEAIELFHRIGADGAEIVVQDGYCSGIPCDCDEKSLSIVKRWCRGK